MDTTKKLTAAQKAKLTRDAKAKAAAEQAVIESRKRIIEEDDEKRKKVYIELEKTDDNLRAASAMFKDLLEIGVPVYIAHRVYVEVSTYVLRESGTRACTMSGISPARNGCDVVAALKKYGITATYAGNSTGIGYSTCEIQLPWDYRIPRAPVE
jgi:hypothetical protein